MKNTVRSFLLVLFVGLMILLLVSCSDEKASTTAEERIVLYPADYDEDIFQNSAYTDRVTDVKFIENGYSVLLGSDNFDTADAYGQLFYRYFDSVKHGSAEEYKGFFASDYFTNENPAPEKFTMQKLYDIEVTFVEDLELEYNDENMKVKDFIVRYKIMYNNGTFRADIPSDAIVPQHYLVSELDGELKIMNIIDID